MAKKSQANDLPCLLTEIRRTARLIERRYEKALLSLDLSPSQYTILATVALRGPLTQGELSRHLELDSTSLSRTLSHSMTCGLLVVAPGFDRRRKILTISQIGLERLAAAQSACHDIQASIQRNIEKHSHEFNTIQATLSVLQILRDSAR